MAINPTMDLSIHLVAKILLTYKTGLPIVRQCKPISYQIIKDSLDLVAGEYSWTSNNWKTGSGKQPVAFAEPAPLSALQERWPLKRNLLKFYLMPKNATAVNFASPPAPSAPWKSIFFKQNLCPPITDCVINHCIVL